MDRLLLFFGVPAGLFGLMVCSLWLGFRWDRARGRWRCPKCWYDRHDVAEEGAELVACPECGFKPRRLSDLQRTRRSRPLVLLGFAQFPVIIWWLGALGGGRGLLWPIPAFALVRIQVFSTEAVRGSWFDQLVRTEVGTRRNAGRWTAEMDADLARSTARTPLVRELNAPKRWPAGVPVPVLVNGEGMLGPYAPTRVEIAVESGGARFGPFNFRDVELRRVLANAGEARPLWIFFAPPTQGGELVVDVRARWQADRHNPERLLAEGVDESATFAIEEVADLASVLPAAPESVTRVLEAGWTVGTLRGGISIKYPEDESIKGVSVGASIELWCGEVVVASGKMWLPVFPREAMTTGQFCPLVGHGADLPAESIEKGPWEWRVRSDPTWGAIGAQLGSSSVWVGGFAARASRPSERWLRSLPKAEEGEREGIAR